MKLLFVLLAIVVLGVVFLSLASGNMTMMNSGNPLHGFDLERRGFVQGTWGCQINGVDHAQAVTLFGDVRDVCPPWASVTCTEEGIRVARINGEVVHFGRDARCVWRTQDGTWGSSTQAVPDLHEVARRIASPEQPDLIQELRLLMPDHPQLVARLAEVLQRDDVGEKSTR